MGKGSDKPAAPNYAALAQSDAAAKQKSYQDALKANRPNQVGPTGSLTWDQDAGGNWTQTATMDPAQKQLMDAQTGNQQSLAGKIGEQMGGFGTNQVDLGGAPAMPEVGGYDQRSIDTIRALQAPQLQRQRAAKEAQMAAMGLGTGSGQAWNTEQQNIGDAEGRADLNAIMAGIQEGNTDFGQGMQARQQGVNETFNTEQANLGKLQGLMGLGKSAQMPSFAGVPRTDMAPTADTMGAARAQYGDEASRYNADAQSSNQMLSGLMGLAGNAIGGPIGGMAGSYLANQFAKKPIQTHDSWVDDYSA